MTVDEFLAWAEGREGRYELVEGRVVAMSPERVRHAEVKLAVCDALRAAIRRDGRPCRVLIDGVAVRIDARTSYVPDVVMYCGRTLDPDLMEVPEPIVVVEVVSPSSRAIDNNRKLAGYFKIPSLHHYLVVEPKGRLVIHHRRDGGGGLFARILSTGTLDLDPPGLSVPVAELFADA